MRTRRGLTSTLLTILMLAVSAYFGSVGKNSIFRPDPIISETNPDAEVTPLEPTVNEYVQVVVPPEFKESVTKPGSPAEKIVTRAALPGEVLVTRIVDGDTVELAGGEKVRLIGVDTPETVDPRKSVQCFGKEAKEFTRSLLENQWVRLELDVEPKDFYKRTLAYVWRDDVFVNDLLVHEGFAHILTIPPNVRYVDRFKESEQYARVTKAGLWSACP